MVVWYPESLSGPNASVPWWVTRLVVVAFVVGFRWPYGCYAVARMRAQS